MAESKTEDRLYEHLTRFREHVWPGESVGQIVEHLARFADVCRDTRDFVPGIRQFFPLFLRDPKEVDASVSELRGWMSGLTAETWMANATVYDETGRDAPEAIVVLLSQSYYWCIDPESTVYCGYQDILKHVLVGYVLRCQDSFLKLLLFEATNELLGAIPVYSLFDLCVVHAVVSAVVEQPDETMRLLKERFLDSEERKQLVKSQDFQLGLEDFAFDEWWDSVDYRSHMHDKAPCMEAAIKLFLHELKSWCAKP